MIRLKTDTTEYWTDRFAVTDDDLAYVLDVIHSRGAPCTLDQLVRAVVERRLAEERSAITRELSKGTPYEPRGSYKVGDTLVFPAYDFAVGQVVSERPGANPQYGTFKVIQVHFEDDGDIREFASELTLPHKLNLDTALAASESTVDSLMAEYGESLTAKLQARLADSEGLGFVELNGRWFLRDLMAPIHEGHLNLAEALIEVNGRPMRTEEIMPELDLPRETPKEVGLFSLEAALVADERFDEIELAQKPAWFLTRLEPEGVRSTPKRLVYAPISFSRSDIIPVLADIEKILDDELTDLKEGVARRKAGDEYSLALIYPHVRVGSLPLTPRTRGFFPQTTESGRTIFRFMDGQTGKEMRGWVVAPGKYVLGLSEWFSEKGIAPGAWVKLQKTEDPLRVLIDIIPRRMHRDWVRVADEQNGQLVFQMQKSPVAYEYDPTLFLTESSPAKLDRAFAAAQEARVPLEDDMIAVLLELAKLSPQGNVHAKTLYAALNMRRRCPPGPLFAALSTHAGVEHMGEANFAYRRAGA